jgi:hypothetical protein
MADIETIIIPVAENPTSAALNNAGLPNNYRGETKNSLIVELFNRGLEQGLSFEQMTKVEMNNDSATFEDDNLLMFIARVRRFTPQAPQSKLQSTYWALKTIIDMSDINNHYLIADNYNKTFTDAGVIPDLSIFYTTLWNEFNRTSNIEGFITPVESKKIVNFILLNKSLRDEGIVLPTKEVLACSVRWDKQEIFFLLQQGTKLSEAIKLYDIGFKTVDEVVLYAGAIPETWVDLILN